MGVWTALAAVLAVMGLQCPEMTSGFTAHGSATAAKETEVWAHPGPVVCSPTTTHQAVRQAVADGATQPKEPSEAGARDCRRTKAAEVLVTPFKWVSGTAADVADRVGTEMECRALHEDEEKDASYPTAALERMVEGTYPPFNPDFLVKNKDSQL